MKLVVSQRVPVAVNVGGCLPRVFFQNRRIDDLRDSMNKRFEDSRVVKIGGQAR